MKRAVTMSIAALAVASIGWVGGMMWAARETGRSSAAVERPVATMAASPQGSGRILYWWDPMIGPSSISPKPGVSAMGMKLVPVYAPHRPGRAGEVTIDPAIEQDLAVQTSRVRMGALHQRIRTVGFVRQATPISYAVVTRVDGWIGTLYASTDGTAVQQGEPLLTLYSPQLLAAEEELLAAANHSERARRSGDADSVREASHIYQAIRHRLIYLGVSGTELDQIVAQRRAKQYLTFLSPVSGYLAHIAVRQKSFVKSGQTIMRIEQLRSVWLDAKVYENQMPWVRLGQLMQARTAADPGRTLQGRIFFIDPNEDPRAHTVTVRARLGNSAGLLRPGMYALVEILTTPLNNVLLAPASAVIHTGTGEVALVALGHGRYAPRAVRTGLSGSHGVVQILSGLKDGEHVVTSGQFLIDVESNMSELTGKLTAGAAGRQSADASAPASRMSGTRRAPAATSGSARRGRATGPERRGKTGG